MGGADKDVKSKGHDLLSSSLGIIYLVLHVQQSRVLDTITPVAPLKKVLIGITQLDLLKTLSKTSTIDSDKNRRNTNIMVSDNTKIGTGLLFLVRYITTCRGFEKR